jgi:hypothetical protein
MMETMTWAGPLPGDAGDPVTETMTFAGPVSAVAAQRASEEEAGGPTMWAGPLPSWMDRGGSRSATMGPFSAAQATSRV